MNTQTHDLALISVEFTVAMKPFSIGTRYPIAAELAKKLLKTGDVKDPYTWIGPVSDERYQARRMAKPDAGTDKKKRKILKASYLQGLL